jgi:dipeptidyl aminopeptidase/acylaminoacyl peptidase
MRPALLSLPLLCALLPAQRMTPELLWKLGRISEPRLSPDYRQLAFVLRTYDMAADTGTSQVVLHHLESGVTIKADIAGSSDNVMWSPDSSFVAVVSTRSGTPQIWIVRQDAGEPRQVTEQPGGVGNASLSPTGEYFAFTADVKLDQDVHDRHPDLKKANALEYDDLMVRHWNQWKDGTYSHLFVMPSNGGKARDLMDGERADTPLKPFGGAEQIAWTPDGQELIYTAKKVPHAEVSTDSALYAVSVKGGAAHCLTEGMPGFDQDPVCSPDGRWIAFGSMARAGFESDKMRVFLHDRRENKNRELLPDFDDSVHGLQWAPDSSALFGTVETKGTKQVCRITLDGKLTFVTKGRHELDDVQVGPGFLVALRSTTERPAEVVKIDAASGEIAPVYDWNGALLKNLSMPEVKEEWFKATDGKDIFSITVLPPDFDPHKKYPLLLYCQGGPQSMVGQWFSYRWNFHLMAAQGYVVAAVDRRGLPGFGARWNDQISRDWGGQCMQDLLSVCDAMQQRPYIDKAHTAAVGASFGGYTVYWLMGNGGDRFCCMIAHCGVFNLESMYLSTEELWFPNWDLGGPYWRSPELQKDYDRFSPHRFVQNWKTPLMVIHGGRDYRVPLEQGLQAYTAARVQGVPARLLVFPDEGHWVMHPQNGLLWQREFFRWLDQYCKAPKEANR